MTHFGRYIRDERMRNRVSLRALATALGVSHVFLSTVERGTTRPRRVLSEKLWSALIETIPTIRREELQRLAALSRGVSMNLGDANARAQEAALAFARRVNEGLLDDEQAMLILNVLHDRKKVAT